MRPRIQLLHPNMSISSSLASKLSSRPLSSGVAEIDQASFNQTLFGQAPFNRSVSNDENIRQCSSYYGDTIRRADVMRAERLLPSGNSPVPFSIHRPADEYNLPFNIRAKGVMISVEVAGPTNPVAFTIPPVFIRLLVQLILYLCVDPRGQGGFATWGIDDLVAFTTSPYTDFDRIPFPVRTTFLTVSITKPNERYPSPGDLDQATARKLYGDVGIRRLETSALQHPAEWRELNRRANNLATEAARMLPGSNVRWWDNIGDTTTQSYTN